MKRYYAKSSAWFKEGSECFRKEEVMSSPLGVKASTAIYRGTYVVGSSDPAGYDIVWYDKGYKEGDEVEMDEHCADDEFIVEEDKDE